MNGFARMAIGWTAMLGGALLAAGAAPAADGTEVPSAAAPIVVGIDAGGGPYLTAYDAGGRWRGGFLPYFDFTQGGLDVASADVDGDGEAEIVTAPGRGGRGELRTFDGDGTRVTPTVLATPSHCGTRIAAADATGDGRAELIAGSESCAPTIQVFDGATGRRIAFFSAFSASGDHGVRVAAADVTGDGKAEVIAGNGPGDPPVVRVFAATPSEFVPAPLRRLDAFEPAVTSGLEVAAADLTGDGKAEIVVGAETPDDAVVKVFDGGTGALLETIRPFGLVAAGTLRVAAGDVNGDRVPEIVVGGTPGHGPLIRIFSSRGVQIAELASPLYNGRSLAVSDVDGDGDGEIVTAHGPSYDSAVAVLEPDGTQRSWFQAYGYSFTGGVRVAAGDVDGDGTVEYVTGQGPGGQSELAIFDASGRTRVTLHPFGETLEGLYVAAGDVDGDAKADVVAGTGWGEPRVKMFDGGGNERSSFLAFDAGFSGVRVATGDLDGDGTAEILAAPGAGSPPVVRIFDMSGARLASFYAFDPSFSGGVYVASGDLDGDGKAEIVVGSGTTGDVRIMSANGHVRTSFRAYDNPPEEGVRVGVGDVNGDGIAEIVTGPGRVAPVDVRIFTDGGEQIGSFRANAEFQGGIFVAVPAPLGPRLRDLQVPAVRAVEGRLVRFTASFVDPRGGSAPEKFRATVSWGNGSSSEATVLAAGGARYVVQAQNVYERRGRYRMAVRIEDVHLRALSANATAHIRDAPLSLRGRRAVARRLTFAGVVAHLHDANPYSNTVDFRAVVEWGDGRRSLAEVDITSAAKFVVVGRHRYARPGVYRAVVRVRELGGRTVAAASRITARR